MRAKGSVNASIPFGDPPKVSFATAKERGSAKEVATDRPVATIEAWLRNVASSPVEIRCKGVLFDMDGILISSIGSVERSWTKWAEMRGVDPEYACKMAHGRRAIETAALLRPDLDSEAELQAD